MSARRGLFALVASCAFPAMAIAAQDVQCGPACQHNCSQMTAQNTLTVGWPPQCGVIPTAFQVEWDWQSSS